MIDKEWIGHVLATWNAGLNATSLGFLLLGKWAIQTRRVSLHRRCMLSAFAVSALFLICYLLRVALTGTHRFPGHGIYKIIYFAVLFSHMLCAALTPILSIRAIYLAQKNRFLEHRKIVRFAWPLWVYVSGTGILVYAMLYHWPK